MRTLSLLLLLAACNGKDDDIYASCDVVDDCVDALPEDVDAACIDKGGNGFCTWTCSVDDDCAVSEDNRVCASFESEEALYCFPSCEDDDEPCPEGLGCRSTGGGSDNRKVCFPEDLEDG